MILGDLRGYSGGEPGVPIPHVPPRRNRRRQQRLFNRGVPPTPGEVIKFRAARSRPGAHHHSLHRAHTGHAR